MNILSVTFKHTQLHAYIFFYLKTNILKKALLRYNSHTILFSLFKVYTSRYFSVFADMFNHHHSLFYLFIYLAFWGHMCGIWKFQARGRIEAAAATAIATWYPRHICNLHCSSWQHWILNPLSKAHGWNQHPHEC